jgi:hypothetical protein
MAKPLNPTVCESVCSMLMVCIKDMLNFSSAVDKQRYHKTVFRADDCSCVTVGVLLSCEGFHW